DEWPPESSKPRHQFNRPFPCSGIGETAKTGAHIIFEVTRIVRRRNCTSHRRVCQNPFQEKLSPGSAVKLRRPFWQRLCSNPLEKIASAKWAIDDYGNSPFLRERKNSLFRLPFHDRVIERE